MNIERYDATLATVKNLYALCGEGRWAEVADLLTDDFFIVEADSLPFGGRYEGKDALPQLYAKVFAYWDDASLEIHDITASDEHAIGLLTIHATAKPTGERLAIRLAEVFHLRGDKLCGITPYYFDTAALVAASG